MADETTLAIGAGIAQGLERATGNLFNVMQATHELKRQAAKDADEFKINKLKIKQLEDELSPEMYAYKVRQMNQEEQARKVNLSLDTTKAATAKFDLRTKVQNFSEAGKKWENLTGLPLTSFTRDSEGKVSFKYGGATQAPNKSIKPSDYKAYIDSLRDQFGRVHPGQEKNLEEAQKKYDEVMFGTPEMPKGAAMASGDPIQSMIENLKTQGSSDDDIRAMLEEAEYNPADYGL